MAGYSGIDCAGYSHTGILQRAEAAWGPVRWVGRYLPDYAPSADELAYLRAHGKAILCLWNGITATTAGYGYQYAHDQGVRAAQSWMALGAPKGVAIVGDIEQPWYLAGEFAHGWLEGVAGAGCTGGLYLNPRYGQNHAAAWQYARQQGASGVVYTSQNEIYANQDRLVGDFAIGPASAQPVPGYEGDTCFWQTWENAHGGEVDMDCANERGYSLMWGAAPPPPPAPTRWHVSVAGALKTAPNHSSAVAVYPSGQHANPVPVGSDVTILGPDVKDPATGEAWVPVKLIGPAVVHGYYLRSGLAGGS